MPDKLTHKNQLLIDRILIPITFLVILLLGNYGIFLDHNFIATEVHYIIHGFHAGNMNSSGWRPDLGLGLSYFFGDPGTFHVWALFRWWEHLFSNPLTAYNTSVIALLWAGCLTQYVFLRKALPNLGRVISVFLACMVAFGAERYYSFFLQSGWAFLPIAIPLISLILYDFSTAPSIKHYFYYTATLTLALVLGSTIIVLHLIFFSCGFFLVLVCFQRWYESWTLIRFWFGRFILLNLSTGFSILILAAWTFYSMFVENQASHYVRDPNYESSSFFISSISIKFIFQHLLTYIQPNFLSPWSGALGPQQLLGPAGFGCFSILLPIVLLIALFHKSRNFWEFSFKCVFIGTVLYQELLTVAPGLMNILQYIRPVTKPYAVLQIFGVLGLGICISRIRSNELKVSEKLFFLIRCIAFPLCVLYATLLMVALLAILAPESLNNLFANMWGGVVPYVKSASLKDLMPSLILENVRLFHETMGVSYLFFYGSALMIMGLFSTRHGIDFMKWRGGVAFAGILFINQIFLSWAVYPMNSKPPIWEEQFAKKNQMASMFSPTDRIMRVGWPLCNTTPDYFECIKRKFIDRPLGSRRWIPGYMTTLPVYEVSAGKSYTQYEVSAFIKALLKPKDFQGAQFNYGLKRDLQRDPPIYSSKLYDIAGVKYLLSQDPLEETGRIELAYSDHQFFLYRYLDSWPYFYLADQIKTMSRYEDLLDAKKGEAYLWKEGPEISIISKTQNNSGTVELALLELDRMEFDYSSDKAEFLVISDAWHPNWKAKVNSTDTEIVKANGVFKGILLPPGKGKVQLHFDNSSYRGGIWVSFAGWTLFIGSWIVFSRRSRATTIQNDQNLAN
jgi:hypothetical protein